MTDATAAVPSRVPLNRERVIRGAIELADEKGIEALTMRGLAKRVGVEAMSLYNHIADKEDLLGGMVDVVVAEIEFPSAEEPWRDAMRRRAVSAREVLNRHPWASSLIEASPNPSLVRLAYPEAVLASLRQGGFSVAGALHAFAALDSYIYGFVLQERNLPFTSGSELASVGEAVASEMPADQFPYLTEVVSELVTRTDYDFRDEFYFGLDLLLDALERVREAE